MDDAHAIATIEQAITDGLQSKESIQAAVEFLKHQHPQLDMINLESAVNQEDLKLSALYLDKFKAILEEKYRGCRSHSGPNSKLQSSWMSSGKRAEDLHVGLMEGAATKEGTARYFLDLKHNSQNTETIPGLDSRRHRIWHFRASGLAATE